MHTAMVVVSQRSGIATKEGVRVGPYRVLDVLGCGGMGVVYLAERARTGERVALKMMRPEFIRDGIVRERLRREAEAVRRVRHPNVVALLDQGDAGPFGPYLAFEWLDGVSLATRLQEATVSQQLAIQVIDHVLLALEAAHSVGVIHRDLKPENILLSSQPSFPFLKVLDFGISRVFLECEQKDEAKLTRAGTVVGTPIYMAPGASARRLPRRTRATSTRQASCCTRCSRAAYRTKATIANRSWLTS